VLRVLWQSRAIIMAKLQTYYTSSIVKRLY